MASTKVNININPISDNFAQTLYSAIVAQTTDIFDAIKGTVSGQSGTAYYRFKGNTSENTSEGDWMKITYDLSSGSASADVIWNGVVVDYGAMTLIGGYSPCFAYDSASERYTSEMEVVTNYTGETIVLLNGYKLDTTNSAKYIFAISFPTDEGQMRGMGYPASVSYNSSWYLAYFSPSHDASETNPYLILGGGYIASPSQIGTTSKTALMKPPIWDNEMNSNISDYEYQGGIRKVLNSNLVANQPRLINNHEYMQYANGLAIAHDDALMLLNAEE